jgi:hypothetical protein
MLWARIALVGFTVLLLNSCSEPEGDEFAEIEFRTPAESKVSVDAEKVMSAKAEIESWSQVLEVMYDPDLAVPWTVGVVDDGSSRIGLAETVCMELADQNALSDGDSVRIVDRAVLISNGGDFRAASLGRVDCETSLDLGT